MLPQAGLHAAPLLQRCVLHAPPHAPPRLSQPLLLCQAAHEHTPGPPLRPAAPPACKAWCALRCCVKACWLHPLKHAQRPRAAVARAPSCMMVMMVTKMMTRSSKAMDMVMHFMQEFGTSTQRPPQHHHHTRQAANAPYVSSTSKCIEDAVLHLHTLPSTHPLQQHAQLVRVGALKVQPRCAGGCCSNVWVQVQSAHHDQWALRCGAWNRRDERIQSDTKRMSKDDTTTRTTCIHNGPQHTDK